MQPKEGMGCGEEMFIKKRVTKHFNIGVRGVCTVHKYDRATGKLKSVGGPHTNVMVTTLDAGIDLFLQLITNSGTGASSHLNGTDAWLVVGPASPDPINSYGGSTNIPVFSSPSPVNSVATPTKSSPSKAGYWQWDDDSLTVRNNQDRVEVHYLDPDDPGMSGNTKRINGIQVDEGTKPADENWHWRVTFEFYSTDTDFDDDAFNHFLDIIAGQSSVHYDTTNVWCRPFTSGDSALGSTGLHPDSVTVSTSNNTITFVFTAADGVFNGVWAKMEIKKQAVYVLDSANRLRYGGCTTAGGSCGTKVSGEEYEYTYVFTLAQGS